MPYCVTLHKLQTHTKKKLQQMCPLSEVISLPTVSHQGATYHVFNNFLDGNDQEDKGERYNGGESTRGRHPRKLLYKKEKEVQNDSW